MKPPPFKLERYFAQYEFAARYLLCSSDPEAMPVRALLELEPGAQARLHDLWLGYTESRGNPHLREAIARGYASLGADDVLVHVGAQEPIFALTNVALEPGDHAIVQVPAYQSHFSLAQSLGAEVAFWQSDLGADGAPDPDDLRRLLRPNTKLLVITTPNNPTGYAFDRARLDATVAFARKHGLIVLSDEVYRGTERSPGDRQPPLADLYERAVSLGGLAKSFGLPGLRIGWIATRDRDVYARLAAFKDYLTICASAPSEFLATLALQHAEHLQSRVRAIVARNLDRLDAYFAAHADVWEWRRPRAGTTAFPRYRKGSSARFCARLVERAGVLLLPSVAFDAGDERARFGFGRENLPEALAALANYIDD